MGVSKFNQVQADNFMGSIYEASPFGKIWYVDVTNGSDGNQGDGPNAGEAYASIGAAITASVATRGDTIVVAPGTYTITSALAPKAFTTIRAAVVNPQAPSVSVRGDITNLMTVDVNGCRFVGIEFRATGASTGAASNRDLITLGVTTAITGGVTFEDCVFHGADATGPTQNGVAGVRAGKTNATTGLVIRRCTFRDLGKTPLEIGASGVPYAKIEDNAFIIDTPSGWGMRLEDTTAFATGKGYVIRNNEFLGQASTSADFVGISIVGTEHTTAAGIIRDNYFAYCAAAAITVDKVNQSVIRNYVGDAGGGIIVDSAT